MRKSMVAITMALFLLISTQAGFAQSTTTADTGINSTVYMAWQPFEFGVMVWFQDTDQIWVLDSGTTTDEDGDTVASGNGTVTVYSDAFSDGSSTSIDSDGCSLTPVRGFGLVWDSIGGSGSLGCPLANEIGYETGGRVDSATYSLEILGPGNTRYGVDISGSSGTWQTISYN
ncbi:MAG: hypothetical protein AAF787_13435 [Chloroflexota bacterium]